MASLHFSKFEFFKTKVGNTDLNFQDKNSFIAFIILFLNSYFTLNTYFGLFSFFEMINIPFRNCGGFGDCEKPKMQCDNFAYACDEPL